MIAVIELRMIPIAIGKKLKMEQLPERRPSKVKLTLELWKVLLHTELDPDSYRIGVKLSNPICLRDLLYFGSRKLFVFDVFVAARCSEPSHFGALQR